MRCSPATALLAGLSGCAVCWGCAPRAEHGGPTAAAALTARRAPELELVRALPIAVEGNFEPSGLLLHEGRLLTVSDKHDAAVYELVLGAQQAEPRPFVTFRPPEVDATHLDYEGLTVDADGSLLVVSESRFRVLRLELEAERDVGRASWLTPSLRIQGEAGGCFRVGGAYFEGITRLPSGELLLAVERQPRGLMELGRERTPATAEVWVMADSAYPLPAGRPADFADLTVVRGEVYALSRNAHLVTRLTRAGDSWQEGQAFSYAAAENDPRLAYESPVYGRAEGLAVSDSEVFVVLDNNGDARAADPSDHRPMLLVFARPGAL